MRSSVGLFVTLLAVLVALGNLGCSELAPTNPYDPATPLDQQARGAVRGRVVLTDRFTAEAFVGGRATLATASAPAEVAFDSALAPEGEGPTATFVLEKVPGGLYWLRVNLTGFDTIERFIEVPRGGDAEVGDLSPLVRADAVVEGQARLEGDGVASHEGTLVSALGTPFVALTGADGAFRLAVSEGTFTLQASHEGYESASTPDVVVGGDETTRLPEPLLLRAAPGAVHVTVRLQPSENQARLVVGASVALAPASGGDAILAAQPDAQGNALLAPVPAGEYTLSVTLAGYGTDTRQVTVLPGRVVEAGAVTLSATVDARTMPCRRASRAPVNPSSGTTAATSAST